MKYLCCVPILALLTTARSHAQADAPVAVGLYTRVHQQLDAPPSNLAGADESPLHQPGIAASLPDSPGAQAQNTPVEKPRSAPQPCPVLPQPYTEAASAAQARYNCVPAPNPYRRFLDNGKPIPLTSKQKGYLAMHDIIDPFNLLTIIANSAITIGINSHSAYGPGMRGFGKNVGYSFSQDATGEVIGTFGICSILHEDPHYHRMPSGKPFERVVHAISRTVIAQHDDGRPMPNYETLITYPASAEISNLYVPGISDNLPSTVERILVGLATDPVNNIVTEFLPDFAKRVHIRVVFLQQIINQVATGPSI